MVDQPFQQDQELADDDIKHCYIIILLLTHLNLTTTTMILPVVPFWHLSLASCVHFLARFKCSLSSLSNENASFLSQEKKHRKISASLIFLRPHFKTNTSKDIYLLHLHTEPGRR